MTSANGMTGLICYKHSDSLLERLHVAPLNGSRTRTPGLEDLYAAFASPEQIKMGMTGLEPASDGLKARCITVLLHTRMSHTGFEPVLED